MENKDKKIKLKMKNTLKNGIIPLMLFVITLHSCTEELDQVNPNALTNESFWQNTGDLNAGLNAVYASLRDENIIGTLFEPYRTDVAVPGTQRNFTSGNPIYDQTFDLTTDEVQDKWDACFTGVFRANQVIDAYEDLKSSFGDESSQDAGIRIVAQARALRGYYYYVLHNSYNNGSLPLFATVPATFDEFQKSFSSSDDIKEFYREDLQYGLENLPKTYNDWGDVGSGNLGRVTAGFCEALIAKSYMNENDFTTAEPILLNVINNYNYNLADNLEKCFTGIDEFNNESIFEINYKQIGVELGTDEKNVSQRISSILNINRVIQPSSWITLKYRAEKPDPLDDANYLNRNLYDRSNGDLIGVDENVLRKYSFRMGNSISSVDDVDSPMYGVTTGEYGISRNARSHAKASPNFWKKFTGWNTENGGDGEDQDPSVDGRSGINIPVIRLAEIYLLYAECMIEKGDLTEALRYINRIRKRSHLILLGNEGIGEFSGNSTYMNDIDMDPDNGEQTVNIDNLREHLRFTEKPLELALEGVRYIDLRRWGVWKQQLQAIALPEYDAFSYRQNINGANPIRFRCFIVPTGEVPPLETLRNPNNIETNTNRRTKEAHLKDHLLGSQNFNESLHSYFPIPQDEINSNLNSN
ncbi:RagB/SusD family nutrient uptake outer membrane protein [Algibacter amylolyticus]|uniref:RagB/SusD family nutrient uptake outer membrane protein n=2 Tax=Algibacter amylolyticus TaxID=1608400 RepID=A0A5M7B5G3_9FLAO|nr:RagB/SusD family nutrient uptake outer membrane protein [Algibacter amylolyticus]TSJ75958.1 RagB/SusD family nutrient uptake outer membrane protein [Algibacter amylolyticus]